MVVQVKVKANMFGHLTNGIQYCMVLLNFIDHNFEIVQQKTYVFLCGRDRVTGVGAEHIDDAVEAMVQE